MAGPSFAGQNLVQQAINSMVSGWLAQIFVKPKVETASQICTDFKAGLITGREALMALRGLGYSAQAAMRILSICYLRKLPKTLQTMPRPGTKEFQAMQDALNG